MKVLPAKFAPNQLAAPCSIWSWILLLLGPPLLWLTFLYLGYHRVRQFLELTREDGVIENVEALLLGLAFLGSLYISWKLKKEGRYGFAFLYLALAVALFLVAGEEISWGQRIFGLKTPVWLHSRNRQHELNFHNLHHARNLVWVMSNLMALLLVSITACAKPIARRLPERWQPYLWLPHPVLLSAWLCYLAYHIMRLHLPGTHLSKIRSRMQEPSELLLYLGVFAFVLFVATRVRANARARSSS